jgi:pimeloyl-ACP methyl ester carboxylesterase
MAEVTNDGVRIGYDVLGRGRPLILLHGWSCDRTWWTEPGYVEDLERDFTIANVDSRGHGSSDKPHDVSAYHGATLAGDVLTVADAEGFDRFAIWGQSFGGWIAWITAAQAPERVAAIVTTGAWDPRPDPEGARYVDETFNGALREGGTEGLVALFKEQLGELADQVPDWANEVTLRADAEALIACRAPELDADAVPSIDDFPVPALLIAGELEDEKDDAAKVASMIRSGQSLRLPGMTHPGACLAAEQTVPAARAFLERWFDQRSGA